MLSKNPKADLRLQYPMVVEIALIVTLFLMTTIFVISKEFQLESRSITVEEVIIKVEDIPITNQIKRPPPPASPIYASPL